MVDLEPCKDGCIITKVLTWRPVEQAAFRWDDPHPLEELRVGQRQLDHLTTNKSSTVQDSVDPKV